jgi:hypothetical protein
MEINNEDDVGQEYVQNEVQRELDKDVNLKKSPNKNHDESLLQAKSTLKRKKISTDNQDKENLENEILKKARMTAADQSGKITPAISDSVKTFSKQKQSNISLLTPKSVSERISKDVKPVEETESFVVPPRHQVPLNQAPELNDTSKVEKMPLNSPKLLLPILESPMRVGVPVQAQAHGPDHFDLSEEPIEHSFEPLKFAKDTVENIMLTTTTDYSKQPMNTLPNNENLLLISGREEKSIKRFEQQVEKSNFHPFSEHVDRTASKIRNAEKTVEYERAFESEPLPTRKSKRSSSNELSADERDRKRKAIMLLSQEIEDMLPELRQEDDEESGYLDKQTATSFADESSEALSRLRIYHIVSPKYYVFCFVEYCKNYSSCKRSLKRIVKEESFYR